jgi:hypothetical protein
MNVMRKHIVITVLTVLAVMTGSSAQSQTNQVAEQAKADSLKDVPEFLGLDQIRTEKELQQLIANRGVRTIWTQDGRGKICHVYRSDGENVRVFFSNDGYSSVQRMSRNASYADRLFNGLGKAAKSLQVTLRTGKTTWKAGENLALEADLLNNGPDEVGVHLNGYDGWGIEMDAQWFRPGRSSTGHAQMLAPGAQATNISIPPASLLDNPPAWSIWLAESDKTPNPRSGSPLELAPGRHTIRGGVYPVMDSGPDNRTITNSSGKPIRMVMPSQATPGKPERAVSNPIEIEVVP